jgi:hypothetical protein
MATGSKHLQTETLTAASSMSASTQQFCVVKLVTGRKVVPVTAETDIPFGVLQNSPGQDELAIVAVAGQTKIRVGGTDVSDTDVLGVDATARARSLTAGTGTTLYVLGRVLDTDASDNDGGLISALIDCRVPRRNA